MQHPTPEQIEQMASLGRLRMPLETGGVIVRGELLELPNRAPEESQGETFTMTMDDLAPALGDSTIDEVLFWHTHPSGWVGPSRVDLEGRLEGFQYLVVALSDEGAIPVRY